jgi:hypothetical protein
MLHGPDILDYLIWFSPNCQFGITVYIQVYPIITDNNIDMINQYGGYIKKKAGITEKVNGPCAGRTRSGVHAKEPGGVRKRGQSISVIGKIRIA